MRAIWLQPWAWVGLVTLGAPVLIHLLARHRQRELAFPSLRFVRATQLAALKRRVISDVPLLVVRLLILAAAIAALAAPVFVSASRQRHWLQRTARAIVTSGMPAAEPAEAVTIVESERATAFVAEVFAASTQAADAIEDAVGWLDEQPPAARELVVIGDLREGSIAAADLSRVPPEIGIRFLPTPSVEPPRTAELAAVAEANGTTVARTLTTTLNDDETRVAWVPSTRSISELISVRASPGEEATAAAVRDAVLAEGVRLPRDGDRRIEITFAGAPATDFVAPPRSAWMRAALARLDGLTGGERDDRLVVRAAVRATDPGAVHVVNRVVRAAWLDPLDTLEPRRIPAATLASWSRAPSGAPGPGVPGNEGDARWLWLLALGLLALETWLRRSSARSIAAATASESEARVA